MALACHLVGCDFVAPGGANPAMDMAAIVNDVALVHPDELPYGARDNRVKPPPLVRPSIDIGCSPAQWANFMTRWTRFWNVCNIPTAQLTTQAMECFSEELISTADTGYFYVTKKNPRTKPEKLELMKYDPKARKHVLFKESKIK